MQDVSLDSVGEFFQPVSTKFYAKFLTNGDLVVSSVLDSVIIVIEVHDVDADDDVHTDV